MSGFDIEDVARIHGLQTIKSYGGDTFAVCPFCNDTRGKFSYTVQKGDKKNIYHCFVCDASGDMIKLHMELSPQDFGISFENRDEAKRDIAMRLGQDIGYFDRKYQERKIKTVNEAKRADKKTISATLYAVTRYCGLKDKHKRDLHRRGFTDASIKQFHFASAPDDSRKMAAVLKAKGYVLKGVPGFYIDKGGEWNFSVRSKKMDGYLCPCFDGNFMTGFQERLDNPKEQGQKYIWVSSANRENGTGSGALCTLLPGKHSECIIITEGILKAITVYVLLHGEITIIGVPGVKSLTHLKDVLERFKDPYIIEAFDMDKCETKVIRETKERMENENILFETDCKDDIFKERVHKVIVQERIARAATDLRTKLYTDFKMDSHDMRWDMTDNLWNGKYKGLDDFLLDYEDRDKFSDYCLKLAKKNKELKAILAS